MRMEAASIEAAAAPRGIKFRHPDVTADGDRRASVALDALRTLWFNTGTLCNLTCRNCYIESSPTNDRLAYLSLADVVGFLDEIAETGLPTREIGLTGGEPFMNPDIAPIVGTCLDRGFSVLVLTNAMRPMMKRAEDLLGLKEAHGARLTIRVSLDHYGRALHEMERGERSWEPSIAGFAWLVENGFNVHVCGRTCWDEPRGVAPRRVRAAVRRSGDRRSTPTIRSGSPSCPRWTKRPTCRRSPNGAGTSSASRPDAMMCASQRMVVKRKGERASVVSCTLLPYDRGVRPRPQPRGSVRRGEAQPPPLRAVLRARRRRLQPGLRRCGPARGVVCLGIRRRGAMDVMPIADVDRTLPSNRLIFEVRRDMRLFQRFRQDMETVFDEYGLSETEKEAFRKVDIRRLAELGVHPYFLPQVSRFFHGGAYNHNDSDAARTYARNMVPGTEDA